MRGEPRASPLGGLTPVRAILCTNFHESAKRPPPCKFFRFNAMRIPMNLQRLFACLPPAQRRPLLQRLLIVWAVALPIGLGHWISHRGDAAHNSLAVAMV